MKRGEVGTLTAWGGGGGGGQGSCCSAFAGGGVEGVAVGWMERHAAEPEDGGGGAAGMEAPRSLTGWCA